MRNLRAHISAFAVATFIVLVFGAGAMNWIVMPWATRHGQELEVPDVTERTVAEAERVVGKYGLRLVLDGTQNDPDVPPGHIVSQMPEAYLLVKKGRRIYVTVSKGGELFEMIVVSGGSVRRAKLMLRQHGFEMANVVE
ncbi:unnamed protein product, partial [marine sediment metagenome]